MYQQAIFTRLAALKRGPVIIVRLARLPRASTSRRVALPSEKFTMEKRYPVPLIDDLESRHAWGVVQFLRDIGLANTFGKFGYVKDRRMVCADAGKLGFVWVPVSGFDHASHSMIELPVVEKPGISANSLTVDEDEPKELEALGIERSTAGAPVARHHQERVVVMAELRIYKVNTPSGSRLVKAPNKVQAVNHIARSTITAELASQDDLVSLTCANVKVELAGEESESVDPEAF